MQPLLLSMLGWKCGHSKDSRFLATHLSPRCVGRGVKLGPESSSGDDSGWQGHNTPQNLLTRKLLTRHDTQRLEHNTQLGTIYQDPLPRLWYQEVGTKYLQCSIPLSSNPSRMYCNEWGRPPFWPILATAAVGVTLTPAQSWQLELPDTGLYIGICKAL